MRRPVWLLWIVLGLALAVPSVSAQPAEGEGTDAEGDRGPREADEVEGEASAGGGASAEGGAAAQAETGQARRVEPWANTEDVEVPEFLDTTDERIEDTRPPPSDEQVAALEEMEAEVERFADVGASYRGTVNSLLKREYMRQRRNRNQWYARQIDYEEELLDESRQRAIELFEQFIERYPDDPTYTPDAMFRLGELYFERSSIRFQKAYAEAQEKGEETPLRPDFTPTIELYKKLVRKFPDYRRIDGVYYLIGYTLNEMGEHEEARLAWLNLVCANNFTFDPDEIEAEKEAELAEGEPEPTEEEQREEEHPALTLDDEGEGEQESAAFVNPFEGCTPVKEDARFVSETWFRIGEYHFDDYGAEHALDLAIAAYKKIVENPEDRNYNLALYKLAWAYYRASRYPEAIETFGKLVQWSDDQQAETGKAGSELRPEAIQYLGIAFAYDDWNENQIPDPDEGMPTPLQRVQDPELLPQDRSWTPEVYFQLGQVLYDEAKYDKAIEVWQLTLDRWPMHHRAPEIQNLIARAHSEKDRREAELEAWAKLGQYGPGSEWYDTNTDHPIQQREAEELAENALIGTAIRYHQEAQALRRRAVTEQDTSLLDEAIERYGMAADAYRKYLENHPNSPQAYELQYNLADALYWSERYEDAAKQYAAVRDSNLDDAHLAEAARRVVESLKRVVEEAEQEGRLSKRTEPPPVEGDPPKVQPVELPELYQRIARARELFLARVSEEDDVEDVREAYDFNNALLLYLYGYWDLARERFQRIFEERCKGQYADETGKIAWKNLNNMAVALEDTDVIQELSTAIQERQCTFKPGVEASDIDCSKPENEDEPACLAGVQLTNIQYKKAVEKFDAAENASGEKQRKLYEEAATMLVNAVNEEPDHPQAPLALKKAALALERTSRFESAADLYQRIIDEVGPREAEGPEEQKQLDEILASAYFRLAYNANRFFEFDRAVENYRTLADSRRFRQSESDQIQEWRQDALINAAIILEQLQRYREAVDYYERAVDIIDDAELKRRAYYRMAEVAYKQKSYGTAIRRMEDFIRRYQGKEGAGELVVQAHWRIAQVRKATRSPRYESALRDVVQAFNRSGLEPGSIAAEYAAHAAFLLADDEEVERFESFEIDPGTPATMKAYVQEITDQIDSGSVKAKDMAEKFNDVPKFKRPTWTIASLVRQGRIYEVLARAVLNTPFVIPRDMQRELRRVSPMDRDMIKLQIQDKVQQVLDQKVRPIECLAVARYALAARAARVGSIDNEHTRSAIDRLQAYGDERIAECIEQARANDPSFQAYRPGEFARAPRGQNREPEPGVGPPSLATGN